MATFKVKLLSHILLRCVMTKIHFLHLMQICEGTEQHISITDPHGVEMEGLRNMEIVIISKNH